VGARGSLSTFFFYLQQVTHHAPELHPSELVVSSSAPRCRATSTTPTPHCLLRPLHCTAPSVPIPHTGSLSCSQCHMCASDAVSLVGAPPHLSRELLTQYRPRRLLHHSGAPSHHKLRPWELNCAYELLHVLEHCPSRRA
jgi:hypothetical protein